MGKLEAIRARHEDVPDVLALCDEAERLRGYKEREDQEGVHIHHCPRQGESVTPCCGKTPFEIPGWHRMTAKPELVNCGRLELEAEVERLRGVVQAAREVWRLYDGPANYPLIGELGVALAALEAGDG